MIRILLLAAIAAAGCGNPSAARNESPGSGPRTEPRQPVPESIVHDLGWRFVVTTEEADASRTVRHEYVSVEPVDDTPTERTFLRASLTATSFPTAEHALATFTELAASADPDIGLSYAWDYVVLDGPRIFHLHAGCLFSDDAFAVMTVNLDRWSAAGPDRALLCRCGAGCETTTGG